MKKGSILKNGIAMLFIALSASSLSADTFQVRYSNAFVSSKSVQQIYGRNLGQYSIEASKALGESLEVWGNVAYTKKEGHSLGLGNKTSLQLIPVSAGVNWIFRADQQCQPYLGAGLMYTRFKTADHSPYVHHTVKKWRPGASVKSGVRYLFHKHFFANVFLEYDHQKFKFTGNDPLISRQNVNLSGFKLGLGIGVMF